VRTEPAHGNAGFTLVEVLVTLVITGFIVLAMTGAIIIGFRSTSSSEKRLAQNRDIELVQAVLPRDIMTATGLTAPAAADQNCSGRAAILKVTWQTASLVTTSTQPGPPVTTRTAYEVDYVYEVPPAGPTYPPPGGTLRRLVYTTPCGAPISDRIIARSLSRTVAPVAEPAGKGVTVTLTDASGNKFQVNAKGRS